MEPVRLRRLPLFALLFASSATLAWAAPPGRGARALPAPTTTSATPAPAAFTESHALVIGVSNYRRAPGRTGWPSLRGVADDVREVSAALTKLGFTVETKQDLGGAELASTLRAFIDAHGLALDHRLLIYFAGHGASLPNAFGGTMGYLVPADAPAPESDREGFLKVALSMNEVESLARRIQSRHALFVFDACFAGSIFTTMRGEPSAAVDYLAGAPVRQFITAGDENQSVPDESVFRRQFVAGLTGAPGLNADYNHDGYVTGTELGEFLFENVKRVRRDAQTPRTGKLGDPLLSRGDFLFRVEEGAPAQSSSSTAPTGSWTLMIGKNGRDLVAGESVDIGARIKPRVRPAKRSGALPTSLQLLALDESGARAIGAPAKVTTPLPAEIALPEWTVDGAVGTVRLVAVGTTREIAPARVQHELLASLLDGGAERVGAEFVISTPHRLQRMRPQIAAPTEPAPLRLEVRNKATEVVVTDGSRLATRGKYAVSVHAEPNTPGRYLYVFGVDPEWQLTLLSDEPKRKLPMDPARAADLSLGAFVVGGQPGNEVFFLLATDEKLPSLDLWTAPDRRDQPTRELEGFLAGLVGGEVDADTVARRVAAVADEKLHAALAGCSVSRIRASAGE